MLKSLTIDNFDARIKKGTRIDNKFINSIFELDNERRKVKINEYLGDLDFDGFEGMNMNQAVDYIKILLEDYPDNAFIKIQSTYDGGDYYEVFQHALRDETDDEVYLRLKSIARELKANKK